MSIRVEVTPDPKHELSDPGGVTCEQRAEITVDPETFEQLWTPSTLELLARLYWRFVETRTRGLVRIEYGQKSQTVGLARPWIPLIRFRLPEFHTDADRAWVQWPIEQGLLVARAGRGQGYLRIEAVRDQLDPNQSGVRKLTVSSTVSNFYPWIRGSGWFSRVGGWIYSQTQLRIHIAITNGFLESLSTVPDEVIRAGAAPEDRGAGPL
ncbi:MAG: hypothetical protein M3Y45_06785 [Actinomycetota bacterium]|nr:hypothetical protein [Actinomycetota bacterium]